MDKTNGRYVFLYNGLTGCLTKPLGHMHINFIVCKKKKKIKEECVGLKETGNGTIFHFLPDVV